jgi:hypothetical protein
MNAVCDLVYSHLNYGLCLQHGIKDKQHGWLPVKFLIQKRIISLTYLSLNDLLQPCSSSHGLRSVSNYKWNVPRTHTKMGDRSFSVSGPKLWNSLPLEIRQSSTVGRFENAITRHLTSLWMNDVWVFVFIFAYVCFVSLFCVCSSYDPALLEIVSINFKFQIFQWNQQVYTRLYSIEFVIRFILCLSDNTN